MRISNADIIKKNIRTIMQIVLSLFAVYCIIRYSKECSDGIMSGISFCVGVLVPSLFLFMVVSSYIANSSVSYTLSKIFEKPARYILGLDGCCAGAIIMSLIGGYPVGAKYVAELYDSGRINEYDANKLAMFCVCSGPGFVMNYIGNALLNSKNAGTLLLVSQITAFILNSIIVSVVYKSKNHSHENALSQRDAVLNQNLLVKSVRDGCSATVNMCSMVIVFSAIVSVWDKIFINNALMCDIIAALLEVTTACNRLCTRYSLTVISFVVGFGGICVHFQVFSALKGLSINKLVFFLFRIIQGILSAVTTYILLILFDDTAEVFSTTTNVSSGLPSPVWGSAVLLLCAVCFLGSLNYTQSRR